MKQTRFIPTNDCGLQVREPQEGQQESREIEGRPIVFGVRSVNLVPWSTTRKVYEILEPGCISRELLAKSDVILNLNHSNMVPDVLGRFRNSEKDTLKLEMRGDGIDCRCELPHTNNANDTLELMKRGDITGMSFAFSDDSEDSENGVSLEKTKDVEDGKEVWLRHVKRITGLFDVAIVTHPAYEQTSVVTREQSDAIEAAIEAQIKRECGDDDNAKAAEEEAKRKEQEAKEAAERAKAEEEAKKKAEEEAKAEEERKAREEAEAKAKAEQEERELEEQARRARQDKTLQLLAQRQRMEHDIESFT